MLSYNAKQVTSQSHIPALWDDFAKPPARNSTPFG